MKPTFWKLSQGTEFFTYEDMLQSIEDRLVYVHKDTAAQGQSSVTQGQTFVEAKIGDYFYLTHGNNGVYVLGQFTGPINYFSNWGDGWSDRPFRVIARSKTQECYTGIQKWWSPNHRSTFIKVPEHELSMFEEEILIPFFDLHLKDYGF
ncbi:hypothetical protein FLM06_19320 [Vibrio cholerae]|uniref:EVE domain-containing protein n=1 Tax=Vibrio qinghaiensis TaxID=2025808 RepID=A0A223N312_9VIBR|nr:MULTISPECIES: hypothetical protein [Vibrio]HDY7745253.1 hypothetical protein [Vibrio vulnificus]ASU24090.1 hypothetical protein CCZ37_16305 [Vibrio qinghaiensis]EIC2299155.1 hypothetical protein [Vibrio cholerae]EJL6912718.1 hypothetical protein [Vibrio cholerae]ELJ8516754.1 hypothetical protein [Vibrio cholerae]